MKLNATPVLEVPDTLATSPTATPLAKEPASQPVVTGSASAGHPAPKKKSKVKLLGTILAIIVILIGAGVSIYFGVYRKAPTKPASVPKVSSTDDTPGASLLPGFHQYLLPTAGADDYIAANGVALGPDGNLWFETGNAVGKITPSGQITKYPISAVITDGPLNDITAGPDGNLWFATGGNTIGKITTSGAITSYPIPTPSGVVSAGDDALNITKGPDGNLWFTMAYYYPLNVNVPSENGAYGYAIGKVTTNGAFTEYKLPTSDGTAGNITSGPDGNLWFTTGSSIGKITSSGVIADYPLAAADTTASSIIAGPDGNLWFTNGGEIGKITTSGAMAEYSIPLQGYKAQDITAGPDGNLWFTSSFQAIYGMNGETPQPNNGYIGKMDVEGKVTKYPLGAGSFPASITTGPGKDIWFSDPGPGSIDKFNP